MSNKAIIWYRVSTNKQEVADISLYDHMKLTAAFASAILAYLEEQGEKDPRAGPSDGRKAAERQGMRDPDRSIKNKTALPRAAGALLYFPFSFDDHSEGSMNFTRTG